MQVGGHCPAFVGRLPSYLPWWRLNRMPYFFKKLVVITALLASLTVSAFSQGSSLKSAMALFDQQHWTEAASAFATIEQQSPGKTDALLYRARSLTELGQMNEAEPDIEAYVTAHPASPEGWRELGYIRFRLRKPTGSLAFNYPQLQRRKLRRHYLRSRFGLRVCTYARELADGELPP